MQFESNMTDSTKVATPQRPHERLDKTAELWENSRQSGNLEKHFVHFIRISFEIAAFSRRFRMWTKRASHEGIDMATRSF